VVGLEPAERCFWFNAVSESAILEKLELKSFSAHMSFDDFEEEKICALGSCSNCKSYDSCVEAGCFWEYSLYMCQIGMCYYCADETLFFLWGLQRTPLSTKKLHAI